MECLGIINLNKRNSFFKLANNRPIASIPFGGKYRIIDFVLSNMVNSDIKNIGIFSDIRPRSLVEHLESGKFWDLNRKVDGLYLFSTEDKEKESLSMIKDGDLFNIYLNIDYILKSRQKYVLISPGNMICNINYSEILNHHINSNCDITAIYKQINNGKEDYIKCRLLTIDDNGRITSMGNNTGSKDFCNLSMDMYIIKKDLLVNLIYDSISTGKYSFMHDLIAGNLKNLNVNSYEYNGYLKCIYSIKSYYEANIDLLNKEYSKELFYSERKILTKAKDDPPAFYTADAETENSLISNGCIIEGTVKNSILFCGVIVEKGAVVENSIIMKNCVIKKDVKLNNVIFDKYVTISENKVLIGDIKFPIIVDKNRII